MKHTTMGRLAALILGVILAASCQPPSTTTTTEPPMPLNKFDDPDILRIYELADRRATDSLLPYLSDSSARIRQEAAKVFGSVQDPKALPRLIDLLDDQDHGVVDASAWAIGQIGDSTAAPALLAGLTGKGDLVGDALGKCGTTKDIAEAIAMVHDQPMNGPSRTSVIRAVYRAGLRKRVPAEAQTFALASLQSSQPEERLYAAAFLGRVAESGPILDPNALLVPMRMRDPKAVDDDVRQLLVRAFIRCSDTACNRMLQTIAGDASDNPHVRANAFRAAGKVHDLKAAAAAAVQEKNAVVANAAADYLAQQVDAHASDVLKVAQTAQIWRPRAILLKHALQVAVATKDAKGIEAVTADINSRMNQASLYEQGALLAALAEDPTQHAKLVEEACKTLPITSIYAMEAYLNFDRSKATDHRLLIANIRSVMRTGDEGLIALCAEHISGADKSLWADISSVDFLDSALQMLTLPKDIEAYNAVLKAKAMVLGKAYLPEKLGFQNPIDWKLVQRIPSGQRALIETSIGNIELELQVEDAPGSVANFVKLVQQGFYNGRFIHRMVPAFVAQGGCPRGDGWGSTPETIRSEWAPAHYIRGAVGMASAGKDTESCQWFITHCTVPHLDGRYTIFAQVKSGMDVVDALEVGDKIVRISLPGF